MRQHYNKTLNRWQVVLDDGRRLYRYRYVMEQHIGRPLRPDEHVHHVNGDSTDDRIDNLQIVTAEQHAAMHEQDRKRALAGLREYDWSPHHAVCVECGTDERQHVGHGQCSRCYYRNRARRVRGGEARRPAVVVVKTCEQCGTEFSRTLKQNGAHRRFCSASCASRFKALARWRQAA